MQIWFYFLLLAITFCWKYTDGQANSEFKCEWLSAEIISTIIISYLHVAVQLELGSTRPANNTVVLINDIGSGLENDGSNALVCATQRTPCCAYFFDRFGDWFYPNGTEVPRYDHYYEFYRFRRDSNYQATLGGVLLNRRSDAMEPTGIYWCTIPDVDDVNQMLYVGLYTNTDNSK